MWIGTHSSVWHRRIKEHDENEEEEEKEKLRQREMREMIIENKVRLVGVGRYRNGNAAAECHCLSTTDAQSLE